MSPAEAVLGALTYWDRLSLALRDAVALSNGVQFTAGARHNIRRFRVEVDAHDLYRVEMYRRRRGSVTPVLVCSAQVGVEALPGTLLSMLDNGRP